MIILGKGRQARVYLGDGHQYNLSEPRVAVKIFKQPFSATQFDANVQFLRQNASSRVVPLLYTTDSEKGEIVMEYLPPDRYRVLRLSQLLKMSQNDRLALWKRVVDARLQLPHAEYCDYTDLLNLQNIVYDCKKDRVLFLEGGTKIEGYHCGLRNEVFAQELARIFKLWPLPTS